MHFPLQIAIVGVVEGSQQLALARYVINNTNKAAAKVTEYCVKENLDGEKLQEKLLSLLEYFELDSKLETLSFFDEAQSAIIEIGKTAGICSPENSSKYAFGTNDEESTWPYAFRNVSYSISNGVYTGLGMKLPVDKLEDHSPLEVGLKAWKLVYLYFWASFCLLTICFVIFLFLIRRHKSDLFDWTSVMSRMAAFSVGLAMLALTADDTKVYAAIESPAMLPVLVVLLFLILTIDKLSAIWCNHHLKKSGKPYALEVDEHSHDHHDHHDHASHVTAHETGPLYGHLSHDAGADEEANKAARWSMHPEDMVPLASHRISYNSSQQSLTLQPTHTPPPMVEISHVNPDLEVHTEYTGATSTGYAPVNNTDPHHGA